MLPKTTSKLRPIFRIITTAANSSMLKIFITSAAKSLELQEETTLLEYTSGQTRLENQRLHIEARANNSSAHILDPLCARRYALAAWRAVVKFRLRPQISNLKKKKN